jgi:hypothetical protein
MVLSNSKNLRLSDRDLDFLVETGAPEVGDKARLKEIIRDDEDFRNTFIGDEKVCRQVLSDDEIFLRISPTLFFEILLRKAAKDLRRVGYTLEKTSTLKVPVFDTEDVVKLLAKEAILTYLADMLSSFTKVESYSISFRGKRGIWKKIRFNHLDIHSLMSFCEVVEDEHRFAFYKRIADVCLFILGIFPEYVERDYRYPFSRQLRPQIRGRLRSSPEDYEKEGRRFYKLAAEHLSARKLNLSKVFWALHGDFQKARKPLNFIAEHYLRYQRQNIFWN